MHCNKIYVNINKHMTIVNKGWITKVFDYYR